MAHTILTPTAVTREALRILHQKLNFIGNINRQYDDRFAQSGAKIGDSLNIRLPNQFPIRTGATLSAQDVTESSVQLTVGTQKGVDVNFTSKELTLDLDDFSQRILEPAMSVLAANMEADAYSMYKDVYNLTYDKAATAGICDLPVILDGRKRLNDSLAPIDNNRTCILDTESSAELVNGLKGLFHDSTAIKRQYKEGMMGRTAGFDFYENTLIAAHTTGTAAEGDTSYDISGATQTGSTITVATGTTTFLKGDVITLAGCNRVHPETKADTGVLQQFVVTADSGASATTLSISPAIVTSGAKQNVSASPTNGGAVSKLSVGASGVMANNMAFHKDAFCFATADLLMPRGVHFAAREVMDGLSMRIVRDYDITNDKFPCRIDVLYGYKTLRPELAVRLDTTAA